MRLSGEYTEEEREWLVATGFLRMGPWDSAMVKAPEARQIYLDDVVNSVGQTFLAHPMQCAKCHDHKFDPVPTRDYYALAGIFGSTRILKKNNSNWRDGRYRLTRPEASQKHTSANPT